jgi:DNA-binding response OmpR family regulator
MKQDTLNNSVIWVDEDARMRLAIQILFEGHDIELITAADGIEAIDEIHEHRPKVVVLHRLSPRLEHYAVCSAVRATPGLTETFIMVSSAPGEPDDMSDLLVCGADMTLLRPLDPELLLDVVQDVFQGRLASTPIDTPPGRTVRYRNH